ncbi:cell division protein FtsQ [Mariprofundus micogutta]|uniref:Cell division protein FtsQ n=1 Tax=Mariprofundus micogutta TaxID=1921010 RepID=A0A1L8CKS4_9PROT|nr:cell division protein FtsQ/DivIB [Mariprofundus micogutta]GAV19528.1 cell division protein FtsQ [Mariprofundus micogutta]
MRNNQRRTDPAKQNARRMLNLKRLGEVFAMIAIAGAGLTTGWWMNDKMSVTQWQVEGEPVLQQAIRSKLEAMPVKDFISTRPDMLSAQWLNEMPDLARVDVSRVLPNSLHVRAHARVPVALWQNAKSQLFLFDESGLAYRMLNKGESPDLPLLRVDEQQLAAAHQLLAALQQQDVMSLNSISEVRAGSSYWQVYFSKGVTWTLPFGAESTAIKQLASLLKQPRWTNRNWQVDARSSDRWFIRPAKHGGVI